MKTNSKILVIAIVAIILMSAFSAVNASSASAKEELKNFLRGSYVVCGQTYSLSAEQLNAAIEYLDSTNLPEENYKNSLSNLQDALEDLTKHTDAKTLSDVPAYDRTMAISFVQSATLHVGVSLYVDIDTNSVKAVEKSTGKTLVQTTYATNGDGKVVIGAVPTGVVGSATSNMKLYNIDSGVPMTFTFDVDYANFKNGGKVYINGGLVDPSNYTSRSGSTVIEFKPEYLSKLAVGVHNLTVEFTNGQKLSEQFQVTSSAAGDAATNGGAPAVATTGSAASGKAFAYTGSDNVAYVALAVLAVATVSATFAKKVLAK